MGSHSTYTGSSLGVVTLSVVKSHLIMKPTSSVDTSVPSFWSNIIVVYGIVLLLAPTVFLLGIWNPMELPGLPPAILWIPEEWVGTPFYMGHVCKLQGHPRLDWRSNEHFRYGI